MTKVFAIPDDRLAALAREHGTPLYVYDGALVERRIRDLAGFDAVRYAQKANSNITLLALARRSGALVDAVSAGEIERALRAGWKANEIAFTADLFDRAALDALQRHACPVNLGSPFQIEQYAALFPGRAITLRVNPGFGHGHAQKVNTGGETSKHGIWHEEFAIAVAQARALGLRVDGVHVHIGSGSDFDNLTRVCDAVRKLALEAGPDLRSISAGGGLPVPYRADDPTFDVERFTRTWRETRDALQEKLGRALQLEVEPGRYLVAECGVLLTEVRGTKKSGRIDYVFVDAGFNTLIRPAMYGAFHTIRALGSTGSASTPKIVAGPLCESGDVLTQGPGGRLESQMLPHVRAGDLLCIQDAGAYGMSMASNYNSHPLPAEVLVENGVAHLVRRRQTIESMLADEEFRAR